MEWLDLNGYFIETEVGSDLKFNYRIFNNGLLIRNSNLFDSRIEAIMEGIKTCNEI